MTGERIRDKIAASKRKGIWVGGVVPLGYRVEDRKLIIDEAEAAIVRHVFARYRVLGSLPALQRELREQGIVSRLRTMASGQSRGGVPLTNGPLQHMLRNRMYRGELNHQGCSYPAEHAAIIDPQLFAAVQDRLDANRRSHNLVRHKSDALLEGLLLDDRGHRMGPSYAVKKGVRYRYYVSAMLVQGRKEEAGLVARVAAKEIEAIVLDELNRAGCSLRSTSISRDTVAAQVERVTILPGRVMIQLHEALRPEGAPNPIEIAWSPPPFRRKREIIATADTHASATRPIRSEARARLLGGIAQARRWLAEIMSGAVAGIEALAAREHTSERAIRLTLSLAFLAPDLIEATVDGTLPRGFGLSRLTDLPASWHEQRAKLGLVTIGSNGKP